MAEEWASSRAELIEPTTPAPLVLAPAPTKTPATATSTSRKPRGRPLGSKNKPKPPVVVTRESEASLRPAVLEVSAGRDVVAAVSAFARRRRVGVSVLCARGGAAAVALRLPWPTTTTTAASTTTVVTLRGRFEVLALSGTVLPAEGAEVPRFSVSLAGAGGQVIGGTLAGEMTAAAEGMVVVAATFGRAEAHRLPAAADAEGEGRGGPEEEVKPKPTVVAADAASGVGVGARLGGYRYSSGVVESGGSQMGRYQQQPEAAVGFRTHPSSARGPVEPSTSSSRHI